MPSSCGGWGSTPEWATTGRVPSACSRARFTERSSTVLFQVGSSWAARARSPMRRRAFGSPHIAGSFSMAIGSLWPHQMAIDGWWPSSSTAAAGLADGLLADASGVAPLEREVLPQQQALLVGRVVQLGAGDVGVDAEQVEAGVEGEVDVAGQLGRRGLGQGHAGGALVRALEEEALAVDRGDPARMRTWRRPVRSRRSSDTAPLALPSSCSTHLHGEVVQGRRAEGPGPPQRRAGRP